MGRPRGKVLPLNATGIQLGNLAAQDVSEAVQQLVRHFCAEHYYHGSSDRRHPSLTYKT